MRVIRRIAILLLLPIFLYTGYRMAADFFLAKSKMPEDVAVVTPQYVEIDPLDTLLVQEADVGSKQILRCLRDCKREQTPLSIGDDARSDGVSWYHYVTSVATGNEKEKVILQRTWTDTNLSKTIVEQTPLVKPRGLIMSPDGKKLAYWLDNTDKPEEELTELWAYDSSADGASLIAEHLHVPDILTRLRWNSAGKLLWFVADSGAGDAKKIELIVMNTEPAQISARFATIDWEALQQAADTGVMDIGLDGKALALAEPGLGGKEMLSVTYDGGDKTNVPLDGKLSYVEWLENGDLLYAVQEIGGYLSFWNYSGGKPIQVARQSGVFESARSDGLAENIVFAANTNSTTTKLYTLQLKTGLIKEQASIPQYGSKLYVVSVKPSGDKNDPKVAGVTSELNDSELVAFITKYIGQIAGLPDAKANRIIVTSEINTLYVDYKLASGVEQRLLVTVRDAINPEWSIRGRYSISAGEWRKTEGGGLEDPKSLRIYEWEDSVNQWILKQQFVSPNTLKIN